MSVILRDLRTGDSFNILTFSNDVKYYSRNGSLAVTNETVGPAVAFVQALEATGGRAQNIPDYYGIERWNAFSKLF